MSEFIFSLRVHIEDTDCFGIVYHANYLKYFERARSEWMEEMGIGVRFLSQNGIYFPVRFANINFLKPAAMHDELEVVSQIKDIRSASIVFEQYLRLAHQKDSIICKAEIKLACANEQYRPEALPNSIKDILLRRSIS